MLFRCTALVPGHAVPDVLLFLLTLFLGLLFPMCCSSWHAVPDVSHPVPGHAVPDVLLFLACCS
jgi:hypothetical protein